MDARQRPGGLGLRLDMQTGRTRLHAPKIREPALVLQHPPTTQHAPAAVQSTKDRKFRPTSHRWAAVAMTMTVESKPCHPSRESAIKTGPKPASPPVTPQGLGLLEIEQGHSFYSDDTGLPRIKQSLIKVHPTKIQKHVSIHQRERQERQESIIRQVHKKKGKLEKAS